MLHRIHGPEHSVSALRARTTMRTLPVLLLLSLLVSCQASEVADTSSAGIEGHPPLEAELSLILSKRDYEAIRSHFEAGAEAAPLATASQRNHYYDCTGERYGEFLLRRNGIGCRVRVKGDEAILTVKIGQPLEFDASFLDAMERSPSGTFQTREEHECSLTGGSQTASEIRAGTFGIFSDRVECDGRASDSRHPARVVEDLLREGLKAKDGQTVYPRPQEIGRVGGNETLRSKIPTTFDGVEVVLELDKTTYPKGYVGHELEVEVQNSEERMTVRKGLFDLLKTLDIPVKAGLLGKTTITFFILKGDPGLIERLREGGWIQPDTGTDTDRGSPGASSRDVAPDRVRRAA